MLQLENYFTGINHQNNSSGMLIEECPDTHTETGNLAEKSGLSKEDTVE